MQPNIKACGSFQLPYCMIGWFWLELVCCASRWWWAGRLPYWWLWWFLLNGWWHDGRLIWHPKSLGWTFRHPFAADDGTPNERWIMPDSHSDDLFVSAKRWLYGRRCLARRPGADSCSDNSCSDDSCSDDRFLAADDYFADELPFAFPSGDSANVLLLFLPVVIVSMILLIDYRSNKKDDNA